MNVIDLCPTRELDIVKTFECGQCFRWNGDENGVYRGVAMGHAAKIWVESGRVYVLSDASESFWREYFDLDRDYAAISRAFEGGEYLAKCVEYGMGIRMLRQEPWEALCSFIISQCNNIKRIKGIVERLCAMYGEERELEGGRFYTFPSAQTLSGATEADLAPLRSGYRAAYIINAAVAVSSGAIDLQKLIKADYVTAKKELMKLSGVGEKVANCVVLFGLYHMEAFPVDVWIRRALREHFPPDFDPDTLGEYAGLAQQYIYFYARGGDGKQAENTD